MQEHYRRPGALLQEMDPIAGAHLDIAAAHRCSGQHAFVHLPDLGGMGTDAGRRACVCASSSTFMTASG